MGEDWRDTNESYLNGGWHTGQFKVCACLYCSKHDDTYIGPDDDTCDYCKVMHVPKGVTR